MQIIQDRFSPIEARAKRLCLVSVIATIGGMSSLQT